MVTRIPESGIRGLIVVNSFIGMLLKFQKINLILLICFHVTIMSHSEVCRGTASTIYIYIYLFLYWMNDCGNMNLYSYIYLCKFKKNSILCFFFLLCSTLVLVYKSKRWWSEDSSKQATFYLLQLCRFVWG